MSIGYGQVSFSQLRAAYGGAGGSPLVGTGSTSLSGYYYVNKLLPGLPLNSSKPISLSNFWNTTKYSSKKSTLTFANGERLGISVALSNNGNRLIMGADLASGSGAMYSYDLQNSIGNLVYGETAGDQYGWSVATSADGSTIVVGAPYYGATNVGAIYIYTPTSSTLKKRLVGGVADGWFGISVAVSSDGTLVAVGAKKETHSGKTNAGAAYVYKYTRVFNSVTEQYVENWSETRFVAPDAVAGDEFGVTIALSSDGTVLAVGADYDDVSGITNAGSVNIWRLSGSTWNHETRLQADLLRAEGRFGYGLSMSDDGNIIAVGTLALPNEYPQNSGGVYVFTKTASWAQTAFLTAVDGGAANDYFGYAVALSGNGYTLCVGAFLDDRAVADAGSVHVFTRGQNINSWVFVKLIEHTSAAGVVDGVLSDQFGISVALSYNGDYLSIGSANDETTGSTNGGSVTTYI